MAETNEGTYDIHDNGERPFRVEVTDDMVAVHKLKLNNGSSNVDEYEEDTIVEINKPVKVFVGRDPVEASFIGNSILVQNSSQTYTFIGWNIYKFSSEEQVIEYVSPVGSSDVPYPYAMTDSNIFLMIEGVRISRGEYEEVADQHDNDPYIYYYNDSSIGTKYDQTEVYRRLW